MGQVKEDEMTLQKSAATGMAAGRKSNFEHGCTNNIPAGMANVKNPLKRLRLTTGLPASTLVQAVNVNYPRYDKTLQSKCERTEEYGISLCFEAMDALIKEFAPDLLLNAPKTGRRSKPCRVSCRLTEADFRQLQLLIQDKGHATTQDYLHQLIIRQIRRWEKK
jgi:hypothetical protein